MKRVVASSVISVLILLMIAAAFFYYQFYRGNKGSLVALIPPDVTFVIRADAAGGDMNRLAQTSFFSGHDSVEVMHSWYRSLVMLDSLAHKDPVLKSVFATSMLTLSGHVTGPSSFGVIYYLDLNPAGVDPNTVMKALLPDFTPAEERTYQGVHLFEWKDAAGSALHWMEIQGILTVSTTAFLLEDVIRQQSRSSDEAPSVFLQQFIHSGRRRFEVALRYEGFTRLLKTQLNEQEKVSLHAVDRLGEWSLMHLSVQPNQLVYEGESLPGDSLSAFLNVFGNMNPGERKVLDLLPLKTAALISWNFDQPTLLLDRLTAFRMREKEITSSPDESAAFAKWMGNEIALLVTQPVGRLTENNYLAFIAVKDTSRCMSSLRRMAGEKADLKESYNGHVIRHINRKGILPSVFGSLFNKVNRFYYTQVNGFLVIGNQASSLRAYINDLKTGNLLHSSPRFKAMEATVHKKGNLLFFADIPQSEKIFYGIASPSWVKWLTRYHEYIKNWNGVTFSVCNLEGRFDTRGSIGYFSKSTAAAQLAWNFKLDAAIHAGPFVPAGSKGLVLVQDKNLMLYAIDHQGSLKWKRKLETALMGKIHAADYQDNGGVQYLFNTHSFVYLIDSAGANVGRYPYRLPAEASAGMSCYPAGSGKGQLHYSIPCLNLRQYNYTLTGLPVQGNSSFRLPDVIVQPPYFYGPGSRFFLIDRNGQSILTDRYGNRLQTISQRLVPDRLHFFEDSTKSALMGYGVDQNGKMNLIYSDGRIEGLPLAHNDSVLCFTAGDVNSDGNNDWIVGGNGELTVSTSDGLLLFRFNSEAVFEHCAWHKAGKKQYISASAGGWMYLLNRDGSVYEGFPLSGQGSLDLFEGAGPDRFAVFRADSLSLNYVMLP